MSRTESNPALKAGGVLLTVFIGGAFFFTIIGVFGLSFAVGGLAVALLIIGAVVRRAPVGEDLS